jgi:hypothetical protein
MILNTAWLKPKNKNRVLATPNQVAVPHQLNADSDPAFHFVMRIRIQLFTSMRIRILLLIKVMEICDHWSQDLMRIRIQLFPPMRSLIWMHFQN